jgi:hypothetical protein
MCQGGEVMLKDISENESRCLDSCYRNARNSVDPKDGSLNWKDVYKECIAKECSLKANESDSDDE